MGPLLVSQCFKMSRLAGEFTRSRKILLVLKCQLSWTQRDFFFLILIKNSMKSHLNCCKVHPFWQLDSLYQDGLNILGFFIKQRSSKSKSILHDLHSLFKNVASDYLAILVKIAYLACLYEECTCGLIYHTLMYCLTIRPLWHIDVLAWN